VTVGFFGEPDVRDQLALLYVLHPHAETVVG
jgi:hypothetical protein